MRRTIELYINGRRADIDSDAPVLMNYKQTDAESPAAVYNSYSQQLALPATAVNNVIFSGIIRNDYHTVAGRFSALARTPFLIYNDRGEIMESGYLKLVEMTATQYTVQLYGGLGGFLYGLTTKADGSTMTLADLVYTTGGGATELDFPITRVSIREAWRQVTGLATTADKWNVISFAPAYNGLPGGGFSTKKAFCPTGVYGVSPSQTDGTDTFTDRNGHCMVELASDMDEWATTDLRSYLQRPVIRVKAILDAIANPSNNGGYTVNYDADFFKASNPYYEKLWLTLPKLDTVSAPIGSGSGTATFVDGTAQSGAQIVVTRQTINGITGNKGMSNEYNVSLKLTPYITTSQSGSYSCYTTYTFQPTSHSFQRHAYKCIHIFQLLALNSQGEITGGSKLYGFCNEMVAKDGGSLVPTESLSEFLAAYNAEAAGTSADLFIPLYGGITADECAPMVTESQWTGSGNKAYLYNSTTMTMKAYDVSSVVIASYILTVRDEWDSALTHRLDMAILSYAHPVLGDMSDMSTTNQGGYTSTDHTVTYSWQGRGTDVRSGLTVTKAMLLGGTSSPAAYLLGLIKLLGLYITIDRGSKTVTVMSRKTYYNGATVDLQSHIARPVTRMVPCVTAHRWYDYALKTDGAFADYYQSVYGRTYGMARINTGYEFDSEHNDVLKDLTFRGAAETLKKSKYFVRMSQGGKQVPAPFIDGGKYTLWNALDSNEAKTFDVVCPSDAAAIEYVNTIYPGYDLRFAAKPQFCDGDNKALAGDNVLLFLDGELHSGYYSRYCLTDDSGMMALYNEGQPCWLLAQSTLPQNLKYTVNDDADSATKLYMPRFKRFITTMVSNVITVTHSLELGTPSEVDQPSIVLANGLGIYDRGWAAYNTDRMDADARVVTCKVDLRGLGPVGTPLMRQFYFFDGSLWILNEIRNYQLGGDGLTECQFIRVRSKTAYTNGQSY